MNFARSPLWTRCLLAGAWLGLCAHLSRLWSANSQYSYGWVVPMLGVYMAWLRWQRRPAAGRSWRLAAALCALAALCSLPTWLLLQPSPDWRLANWALTAEIVALTLGVVGWVGGKPWLRHFLFPVCFIFAAVPWPRPVEIPLTDHLMRGVAAVTAELLNDTGTLCVAQGNVIEIGAGRLGVEEACSGLRSLQAALMLALAFGELYSLRPARRLLLLGGAIGVATLSNFGRTYFLASVCSRWGMKYEGVWHDHAATAAMSVCLLAVWLLARGQAQSPPPGAPAANGGRAFPPWFAQALSLWLVACLIGTELWFYDPEGPPSPRWKVAAPPGARSLTITPVVAADLQYDQGVAAAWSRGAETEWMLYYFEWNPGPMRSRIVAQLHRPDRCLPAGGLQMISDRGEIEISAAPAPIRLHAYTFRAERRTMYVYTGVWAVRSRRAEAQGAMASSILKASLQAVLWRERYLGQQVVELATVGYASAAEADQELREQWPRLRQP